MTMMMILTVRATALPSAEHIRAPSLSGRWCNLVEVITF